MDRSLSQILETLSLVDDDATTEDFDPAALVGELKDKVDAIARYLDFLDDYAEIHDKRAEAIAEMADKARARADRLRAYVLKQMQDRQYERLPGESVSIVRRTSGNPSVEVKRPAEPKDVLAFGDLVREVPRSYSWDKVAIKQLAKANTLPEGLKDLVALRYKERVDFESRALSAKERTSK